MKLVKFFYVFLALSMVTGAFMACEPEVNDDIGPTLTLSQDEGFVYQDTSLEKGAIFKVRVTATPGTNDLKLFQVNENDVLIDLDRLISGVNGSPQLILGTDVDGFTYDLEIKAQDDGSSKYTFFVEDEAGLTDGKSFYIDEVFTPFDSVATGLQVFNFSGPKQGSLDLHVPEVVSSSNPDGDIQDEGIDTDLPIATNWIQQIRPKNGAKLFIPVEGTTFEAIDSKEKLKSAVEEGTEVLKSQTLEIGSVYLASTPSLSGNTTDYFILKVDDIVITADNNEDYYVFSLKQALNL